MSLDQNDLQELPPEIGDLPRIRFFILGKNNLDRLPKEIGKLTTLHELHLAHSGILLEIPPEIGNLKHLDLLTIDVNTRLPYVRFGSQTKIVYQ